MRFHVRETRPHAFLQQVAMLVSWQSLVGQRKDYCLRRRLYDAGDLRKVGYTLILSWQGIYLSILGNGQTFVVFLTSWLHT